MDQAPLLDLRGRPTMPGKVLIRADHHRTNKPCAKVEFYDPEAPCSALMAMKALGLENDPIANSLVKVAIETDTANITSEEAEKLDLAVRFASYPEKIFIVRNLAVNGLQALGNYRIGRLIERGGYRLRSSCLRSPIKYQLGI